MVGTRAAPQTTIEVGREGGTELYLPVPADGVPGGKGPATRASIFYNPVMAFSRDLSLSVLEAEHTWQGRRLEVWDALAATGARSMRMLTETDAVEAILATDANPEAVEVIQRNAELEGSGRMRAGEHNSTVPPTEGKFDVVEIDPYGTPQPFVEAALCALRTGGVLGVTATDMAVLAGPERRACEKRYGALPLKGYLCREAGLRILIGYVASIAARQGKEVVPLLSFIGGYYVRVYLRLTDRPRPVRTSRSDPGGEGAGLPSSVGSLPVSGYDGPPITSRLPAGPMWISGLHDPSFLERVHPVAKPGDPKRSGRFLDTLRSEARADVLFYYETSDLAKYLHLAEPPPRAMILERLKGGGWVAERTHASEGGWRTTAPSGAVADVLVALS